MPGKRQLSDAFIYLIDNTSVRIGQLSSYLVLLSIGIISLSVVLRYFFSVTYVALDEIQYYLYSIVFLFGFSYVLKEDGHVKVDIVNSKLSAKNKHLISFLGHTFLTIPWTASISYYAWHYFYRSWSIKESSPEVAGLPAVYILKFILFLAFVLLMLQAISKSIQSIRQYRLECARLRS